MRFVGSFTRHLVLAAAVAVIVSACIGQSAFADGNIVGWGDDFSGQASPPAGNDYIAISAGAFHSLALKSDGSIVGWGYDGDGQASPPAGTDFVAISAGGIHSLALKSDGSIVGWGSDNRGQASPPDGNDYIAIAAGIGVHSLALKSDGSIVGWGAGTEDLGTYPHYGQASPPTGNDNIAIAAGDSHSLALKADGGIVGWGSNEDGWGNWVGQSSPPAGNDYVAIAAGVWHSLALKSDSSIVGWGWDEYGQASPPAGNDYIAIAAGFLHSLALKSDGSIVGWGGDYSGQATPPDGNDYVAIAAGAEHGLALITVAPPMVEMAMKFTPGALNPGSNGNWVKAHLVLPEEYEVGDVDGNSPGVLEPGGIESDHMNVFVNEDGFVEVVAAFDRGAFCEAGISGEAIEVTVTGSFADGSQFYGTDTIKITSNYIEHLAGLASRWLEDDCGKPGWCGGLDLDQDGSIDFADFALFDGCCIEVVR